MNYWLLSIILISITCSNPQQKATILQTPSSLEIVEEKELKDLTSNNIYPWLEYHDPLENLVNRVPTPDGFTRKTVAKNSFADWLRHVPLKAKGAKVHLYDGALKANQNIHEAVVDIDVGKRDLQQCADAIMRLKAEFHFSRKEYDRIHFNFTSGDKVSFDDWRRGRKPIIEGNRVQFSNSGNPIDNTYQNFKSYLIKIFSYAGTASLNKELNPRNLNQIEIGDVFIQGGFPGHAVIVADLAQNSKGEKKFLLFQSYMPAQEIHLLKNPSGNESSPWYDLDFGQELMTPEWQFNINDLKAFPKE